MDCEKYSGYEKFDDIASSDLDQFHIIHVRLLASQMPRKELDQPVYCALNFLTFGGYALSSMNKWFATGK